ncbi:cupin domain-containing protein [Marinilabilia rubra]|nr:cupin domain-containing protein [Marinilabilia rubra]
MDKSTHIFKDDINIEDLGEGISRQILGHDNELMMVKVNFEEGAIGKSHSHPHRQTTYVDSGVFEVSLGSDVRTLKEGDAFYAAPDEVHGVLCLQKGSLIDVFNPSREDFL